MGPVTGKELKNSQSTKIILACNVYHGVGVGDGII